MTYKVYCDGLLLYHSKLESLQIFGASVDLELNKTGSFDFTVYPDHPHYGLIRKLKSIITVYQDDYLLFRGRVLDEEVGWHDEKSCKCEGDMAFLLDSVQPPTTFSGSVADYLNQVIASHNEQVDADKRFSVGNVTVEGVAEVESEEYQSSYEALQKGLFEAFGGYLLTRYESGVAYIDYLSELNVLAPQKIVFGKNLLDLTRTRKGADIATVLYPLGAKDETTGERLTIASVNDGLAYLENEEAIAEFGRIVKHVVFDGISDPAALLKAGQAHFADIVKLVDSIDLTAADLATMGQDITSFHLGTQVQVESKPHGIDQRFLVSKLSIKLLDPASNHLTLGGVLETFTEQANKITVSSGKDGRDGQDAVTLRIDSSRGTVFKNSEVSTVLNVVIFKGGKTITDAASMRAEFGSNAYLEWQWQRMGEETFGTILATDSRISNEGFSLSLSPSDVDTKVVFKCQLVTG